MERGLSTAERHPSNVEEHVHGLFFVNEFKEAKDRDDRRTEAVENAEELRDVLSKFGINLTVTKNVSFDEMTEGIEKFYGTRENFGHVDSIWLLISSHGDATEKGEDLIYGDNFKDDGTLNSLLETVNKVLQTDTAVIIIIQSCRGGRTPFPGEADVPVDGEPSSQLKDLSLSGCCDSGPGTDRETPSPLPFKFLAVPNLRSNQILLWSVTHGNEAPRGFLFNSLCDVLNYSYRGEWLEEIFTKVIDDVSRKKKNADGYKVSPIYYSMLLDKIKMT